MADDLFRDLLDDPAAERGPIFNVGDDNNNNARPGDRSTLLKYYKEEVFETAPAEEAVAASTERSSISAALQPGEFRALSECPQLATRYIPDPDSNAATQISTGSSSSSSSSLSSSSSPQPKDSSDVFAEFGRRTQSSAQPRVRTCWYSFPADPAHDGEATAPHSETLAERLNRLQLEAAQLEEDLRREAAAAAAAQQQQHHHQQTSTTAEQLKENEEKEAKGKDSDAALVRELRLQAACLEGIRTIDKRVARIEAFVGPANYEVTPESVSAMEGLSTCAMRLRGLVSSLQQAAITGEDEDDMVRNVRGVTAVVKGFEENNNVDAGHAARVAALYNSLQRWEATVKALPEVFERFRAVTKANLSYIDKASFDADITKIERSQAEIANDIKEVADLLARISALVTQSQKDIDAELSTLENKLFGEQK